MDVKSEHVEVFRQVRETLEAQLTISRPTRWLTADEEGLPVHGERAFLSLWRWLRALWRRMCKSLWAAVAGRVG